MRYTRLDPLDLDTDAVQQATVAVVGAGATGSRMLEHMARLGADLRIIDRDVLEEPNLATSAIYTAEQVEQRLPKAVAARERLEDINADVKIETEVADLNFRNADTLLGSPDILLDGTDNMETRFLLNEWCVENDVPWVHVSALGNSGEAMPILPGETACFNCVFGDVDGSSLETCETAGIGPMAAATAASLGVQEAVTLLQDGDPGRLKRFDLDGGARELAVARRDDCTVCVEQSFPYLEGEKGSSAAQVCGEDLYQIDVSEGGVDLKRLEEKLQREGPVTRNDHLLRFDGDETFTLFSDGRMLVEAETPERARSIYARFVGA